MIRIEREMIAEARAARQKQAAADIGADIPSAPNDEQTQDVRLWHYAPYPPEFLDALVYSLAERLAKGAPVESSDVPPLCREDADG